MAEENEEQQKLVQEQERAKLQGWVPEEEYRGPKEKWKPAAEFLKIGEERWPIQNERLKTVEGRLSATLEKLDRQDKSIKDFVEFQKGRDQRAVETAKRELKEEQLKAVTDADPDKFLRLEKEIDELDKKDPEKTTKDPQTDEIPPGYDEWRGENEWYGVDYELTAYADQVAGIIKRENKNLVGKAFFNEVGKAVKEKYSEKFENPNRNAPPTVAGGAGGGDEGGGGGKQHIYGNLPPEAKAACEQFVRDIPGFSKEQYCKDYDWGEK